MILLDTGTHKPYKDRALEFGQMTVGLRTGKILISPEEIIHYLHSLPAGEDPMYRLTGYLMYLTKTYRPN